MRAHEIMTEIESLELPTIEVGDEVKVGKFKNRKAIVKGFTKDDHNQPVLKTTKGDQKLFKPRISKLEEGGGRDRNQGSYTPEQARDIGSCAVIAMAEVTGKTWEEVFEVAKPYFSRYGLNAAHKSAIMRELGWKMDGYYKMPWMMTPMNVRQAQVWLKENDPNAVLIAQIHAGGWPHAISFKNGEWHNVLGAFKARLRLVYSCSPI
jgi:hypothetical protein